MRPFSMMTAAVLIACAAPAAAQAATASSADAASPPSANPAAPGCRCPGLQHRHVWHRARHHRHWRNAPVAMMPPVMPPIYHDPGIPSPYDSAYDRAMFLHFLSPPVSGVYVAEPGYPPTPPVVAVQPYRFSAGGAVFQYDGLTGQYIALSQIDARGVAPVAPASEVPGPAAR